MNRHVISGELPPVEMSDVELIAEYEKFEQSYELAEAGMKIIKEELLARLGTKRGTVIGDKTVTKVTRVTFSTTVEEARNFGAIKQVETVDKDVLKKLYAKGVEIPNVRKTVYLNIDNLSKGGDK